MPGVGAGSTLGSDAPFGIIGVLLGNAGGVIRCKIVAISTNAFVVSSPYVSDGIEDLGDCKIAMMSDAAWRKYVSLDTSGKGICWGKIQQYQRPLQLLFQECNT